MRSRKCRGAPSPPPLSECNNPTVTGEGGTSDGTAGALSGGQATSGSAPGAVPGAGPGGAGGAAGTAGAGGAGGAGGGGSDVAGTNNEGAAVGGSGTTQALGAGGVAGALPSIKLGSGMPSAIPMIGAAVIIAFLALGPPLLSGLLLQRRRRP